MGSDLNLPKALTQLSPPPPPQPLSQKSNMPMLYYGLVVVATAAIVLAVYNLLIVRWCTNQYHQRQREEANINFRSRSSRNNNPQSYSSSDSTTTTIIIGSSSIRYKKGLEVEEEDAINNINISNIECSVCLSGFEEGEQVKKLPRCNHWFHEACIDLWLFSHPDCPLCRAPAAAVHPPH